MYKKWLKKIWECGESELGASRNEMKWLKRGPARNGVARWVSEGVKKENGSQNLLRKRRDRERLKLDTIEKTVSVVRKGEKKRQQMKTWG